MSILTSGLRAAAPSAPAAPAVDEGPSFTRGLSRGFSTGLDTSGADLSTLAATTADTVGAGGVAKTLYDTGAGLRQSAAAKSAAQPFVNSFRDVDSVGSGLEYLGGLVGQSAPALGAGLAGALVSRNPMVGATLATAPFAAGSITSRQQDDGAIAALPAGERLASAVGTGLRQAAVENIVPVAMGGKLLGRGVNQAGLSAGRNAAQNFGEAIAGNAAAGALGENMVQRSLTNLNGARDTSGDNEALLEAAVGGAAVGAPLGVAGFAGQAINGKAAAPSTGVPVEVPRQVQEVAKPAGARVDAPALDTTRADANRAAVGDEFVKPAPSLVDRIRGAFKSNDQDIEMSLTDRIAKNQEIVDADTLRNAPPEQHGTILERADNERVEKVKAWASKMYEDASLAPESRAAIDDFMANPGDRTKQAAVAGMEQARTAGESATKMAQDFFDSVSKKYKDMGENRALSDLDSPKLHAAIADTVAPALGEKFPALVRNESAMKTVTGSLRRVMDMMQKDGTIDDDVTSQLRGWFGKDAPSIMAALHNSVGDAADAPATERYYRALSTLSDSLNTGESLTTQMREALPENLRASVNDRQMSEMSRGIREFVEGKGSEKKPRAQVEFERSQIESGLRETFGDKTDTILDAFRTDAEKRRKMATEEAVEIDPEQGVNARSPEEMAAEAEPVRYHGAGKDKSNPQPIRSPEAHRAEFNSTSQAERLMRDLQAENPDRVVQFTRVADMEPAERAKYPDAGPDDGFVTVEGTRDETRLTPDEFQKMRVDTSKTSHAQNNASRIDTGELGGVMDARAIVKLMKGKLDYNESDNKSGQHRTARAFMEGIAAVQDTLGKAFEIPDATVIAPGMTYADAKKLTMRPADPEWMRGMTDEQINKEIATRENLSELNLNEMRKAEKKVHDVLTKREADYEAKVAEMRASGSKLRSADLKQLREDMGVNAARKAMRDIDREAAQREEAKHREKVLENEGRTEVGADENIYRAAQATSPKELQRRTGLDDNPLRTENFVSRSPDGTLPQPLRNAIESAIQRMENMKTADGARVNTIAQRLAKKAQFLFAGLDKMKVIDQGMLASIVKDVNAGKIAAVSETINDLHDNYAKRWAAKEDTTVAGFQENALGKVRDLLYPLKLASPADAVMRAYAKQRERFDAAGKPVDSFTRAFAAHLNVPEAIIKQINNLYDGGASPKKANAFTDRVLGEGDLSSIKKSIVASTDPAALQRVVDSLASHYENPRAREVLDAANERLASMIEADPDVAYSMQRVDPNLTNTSGKQADVATHIESVLGKSVNVEFRKMLHAGEFLKANVKPGILKDTIRISVFSLDPMSTAHHESLHAFLTKLRRDGLMDDAHPLMKAADSLAVKNKLRELLASEPAALKQVERSLEERAAYMYQFWAAGKLSLPAKPAGVLGVMADFFRSVLGIWTNDQRATHIMEYFNSGEYAKQMTDRGAVARSLQEGTNQSVEHMKTLLAPLGNLANAVASTGNGRLRGSLIPSLMELADKVYAPLQGAGDDPGYVPAARIKRTEVLNSLADRIGQYDAAHVTDALKSMQQGVKGASPEERIIMREVKKTLREMHTYMTDAGVALGDLGDDYFPRVWEPSTIIDNEPAFRTMLENYRVQGKFNGSVDQVIAALTRADGSDLQVETVKPGMQYSKERVLGFISALDAEPFLRKNLYDTLNSYVTQATRRAEWSRRFKDDGSGLHDLMSRAKDEGASPEDLQLASDYLQGVDGTLGDSINPKLRRAFGNMIVYQNVRLLPLAIFSSVIDPMGVLVRGGTVGEAFNTARRGFKEIAKNFKKNAGDDEATKLAATLGVIDNSVLMKTVGSSFSQGMTSDLGRRVNDAFFKYNLMEQFNVSMRVGATEAALGFLGRHADGKASAHSARWLAELGLKAGDVVMVGDRPALSAAEFEAAGQSPAKAQASADKMTLAVNKWVDGAVLRPNAAHKPVWMNDPHFALISHLKQFVYSFQETILKRVANEARHGNVGPAYALASYIPFMIAADMAKGVIVGNNQRDEWELDDWLFHGVQRAGLFGVGQFGVDAVEDVQRGGLGVGALIGPTVEQLGDAVSVVAGPQQFETFALNALPANALVDAVGAATASDVVR